jgi:ubiquinone/menaquinone biosynthesis C-methylase UbiE
MDLLADHENIDYLSADLSSPLAMVEMDITHIPMPDNHFDVILCSHVLEHVPDDRKAMSELLRVLKPGGWAIIQVPLRGDTTYENWDIVTEADRVTHFGQKDHVRMYGHDILQRLLDTGFDAREVMYGYEFTEDEIKRLGLGAKYPIFHCRKPISR